MAGNGGAVGEETRGYPWMLLWTTVGAIAGVVGAYLALGSILGVDLKAAPAAVLIGVGAVVAASGLGAVIAAFVCRGGSGRSGPRHRVLTVGTACALIGASVLALGMAKVRTTGARAAETRATAIPSLPPAAPSPTPVATPTPPPTAPPACAAATFGGIVPTRVSQVIVRATEPQQLAPATPNPGTITGEYGAVIVAGTQTIGHAEERWGDRIVPVAPNPAGATSPDQRATSGWTSCRGPRTLRLRRRGRCPLTMPP